MSAIDWILLAAVAAAIGVALYFALRPKQSGCCSGGCSRNCAGCACRDCAKKGTDKSKNL